MSPRSGEGSRGLSLDDNKLIKFSCNGEERSCSSKAVFLLEEANGTSKYTLIRGFIGSPAAAIKAYEAHMIVGGKRKRLTMVDHKVVTILMRVK